jgi:hypothetical protein
LLEKDKKVNVITDINPNKMKQTILFLLFWASVHFSFAQQTVVTVDLPNPCAPTVGVEDYENPLHLKLFPNPAEGIIQISAYHANGFKDTLIKIFDIKGALIYQLPVKNPQTYLDYNLDLSFLASGIYTLSLIAKDAIETEKLIIN